MDSGRWTVAAEYLNRHSAQSTRIGCTTTSPSVLAFAAAARLAVHRGDLREADRQLTQAMRTRPSATFVLPFIAVRVRLQLAKVYAALGDPTTARHLLREIDDVLLHRPALGALVDEVSEFRRMLTPKEPAGVTAAAPLTPAELRVLPYLQTHLSIREIGERLLRLTQHSQQRSRLDLSEVGRLVPERCGAARDGDRPARRVADITHRAARARASSVSYPSASASFGAASTTHGSPTTGTTPTSTSTISAAVAPAVTAASACAP